MLDLTTSQASAGVSEQEHATIDELALLRSMLLLRAYDERAVLLHRQGRIGAYPPFWGEEGIQAGAVQAVRDSDWLFPTYRQNAIALLRGMPADQAFSYFNGDPDAFFDPALYCCAPQCVPLATHIPHAVGWAWGRVREGSDDVAVVFFGDGATSEGDFHEGMNLAGVLRAPVVLLCTNNQWAISTPVARQTAADSIVDKAVGYGMFGVRVDGFDVVAVCTAVGSAAARARAGLGPTLIEAACFRIGPHATADDPRRYRDAAEADAWRAHEPVAQLARQLIARGELSVAEFERDLEAANAVIDAACGRLDDGRSPSRRRLVEHVLAEAAALERQLEDQAS